MVHMELPNFKELLSLSYAVQERDKPENYPNKIHLTQHFSMRRHSDL